MEYIKLLLFVFSFYGYFLSIRKTFKIDISITPIITISLISLFLLTFGLFFNLDFLSNIILFLGLFLLPFGMYKAQFTKRDIISISIYSLSLLFFLFELRGQYFLSYDNFSHWATVVKSMYFTNHFPTQNDNLVTFQSYPICSSLWIYYLVRSVKYSESLMMFSQLMISLSCFFSFSSLIKRNYFFNVFALVLFSLLALTLNVKVNDLMVDSLLPIVSLSCLPIMFDKKTLYFSIPILIFLCQIKASGIFFALVVILIFFVKNKTLSYLPKGRIFLAFLLPCLLSILIWKLHLNITFTNISAGKHSFTISYFINTFAEKDIKSCLLVLKRMISNVFYLSFSNKHGIYLIAVISLLAFVLNKSKKESKLFVKTNAIIYLTYFIMVYLMYIFSMPIYEALDLASFSRYMLSISVLILGLYLFYIFQLSFDNNLPCLICLLLFSTLLFFPNNILSFKIDSSYNKRVIFKKMIDNYNIPVNSSFLIIDNVDNDPGDWSFSWFSIRYDLWSNDIYIISNPELIQNEFYDWQKNFDFLIITNPTIESNYYLTQFGYSNYCNNEFVLLKSPTMK